MADSVSSCLFCGFYRPTDVPHKSALQDNLARVTDTTLEQLNSLILKEAKGRGVERGDKTRTDCTVVQTTIHPPTDSSLLWDGVRRLTLLLNHATTAGYPVEYQDKMREAKRKALAIWSASNEEQRRPLYEQLLELTWPTAYDAEQGAQLLEQQSQDDHGQQLGIKLRQGIERTARVIDQTQRRVLAEKYLTRLTRVKRAGTQWREACEGLLSSPHGSGAGGRRSTTGIVY